MSDHKVQIQISVSIAGEKAEEISLYGSSFVFGRSSSSDVYINDPYMSRSHFQFFARSEVLWIEDLGTSNSTYINDAKLATNSKSKIHVGDIISIEHSQTKVIIQEINFESNITQIPSSKKAPPHEDGVDDALSQIVDKIVNEANAKAREIIDDANIMAIELAKREQDKAIAAFTDNIKLEITLSLEQEKILKRDELNKLLKSEKEKVFKDIETELLVKKEELSILTLNTENKKQVILKELEQEHSERLLGFKVIEENQGSELSKTKSEIVKLKQLYETNKADQLKIIEVEVENRKNELQAEILEFELKLSNSKKEFSQLYTNYELKKVEQASSLNIFQQKKDGLVSEIKSLELEVLGQRKSYEVQAEKQKQLSLLFKDREERFNELAIEKEKIEQVIVVLKQEIQNYKKSSDVKNNEIQLLNAEFEKIKKSKEDFTPHFDSLKEQLSKINSNIENASIQASKMEADNKQNLIDLEKNHLLAKNKFQEEMRELKESEEKRLHEQLHDEIKRISKLKEESLRLVIDLEDSITKEISSASAKIFATSFGASKYNEVAPQFEKALRNSLQTGVLKLLKNDLDPNSKFTGLSSSRKTWKPVAVGMSLSALVFGVLPYVYKEVQFQTDPVQQQLRLDAQKSARASIPVPKFSPQKVKELGSSFVSSVIYTEDFCETYALEEFRSKLIKEGSLYLYKNWQIEEEKSIESYAIIFSMIDALKIRRESINPSFEKRDIAKMKTLETETMKKVERLMGNSVRLEAALKFQARFYNEFISQRGIASGLKD